jgi:subtilisin-like proprotein convertase family protein
MNTSVLLRSVGLALSMTCAAVADEPVARSVAVPLKSGAVNIAVRTPEQAAGVLAGLARDGAGHAIVRLDRPVDDATRARLSAAGVRLQGFLGGNVFLAALGGVDGAAAGKVESLVGAMAIAPQVKIDPLLAGGGAPTYAVVGKDGRGVDVTGAYVLMHADQDVTKDLAALLAKHSAVLRDTLRTVNGAVIELPVDEVARLAAEEGVQWIEPPLPMMSPCNAENRALTQANLVQAAPYNLNGAGVGVLVYDGGTARPTHQDLVGRTTVRDNSGMLSHSTHVAGTIGGTGAASGGNNRGMAPGVTIESYGLQTNGSGTFLYTNPGDIEADYGQAINSFGVDVANNSIGTNTETNGFPCSIQGDYGVTDAVIDGVVRGSVSGGTPFRICWANGNERQGTRCNIEMVCGPGGTGPCGSYYSIAPPATAKNHITVGATNANDDSMTTFSSWGPTDDGRMKPDISAPGCQVGGDNGVTSCTSSSDTSYGVMCGTSMASPTVTGCVALLLQDFRVQFAGLPDPRNSTVKILLAHQAVDRGNPGPDYQFGYGSIRIKDTIDFMRLGSFEEGQMTQGGTAAYTVNVPPGAPTLKAMIAWDDPAATPLAAVALVNDLDLVAVSPSGTTFFPWTLDPQNPGNPAVQTAANHRDNIEQVLVNNPEAGAWTILVTGTNVPQGPQVFSVCSFPNLVGQPRVFLNGTGANTFTDTTGNGNSNGRIDPGESDIRVSVQLRNSGNTPATGVTTTLTTSTPTVTVTSASSAYPDLPGGGGMALNSTPFVLSLSPSHVCGAPIALTLNISSAQASGAYSFSFPSGRPGPFVESYTGPVVPIPDAPNTTGATATLAVSGYPSTISDLNFRFDGATCSTAVGATGVGLDHTFVGDLIVTLTSPQGTTVTLMNHAGSGGNNFCQTVLDDSASTSIQSTSSGAAPFTGSFRPASPLSAFNGQSPNGVWQLHIVDSFAGETGNIRRFSLVFGIGSANALCDAPRATCGSADFNCDGDIGTDADIEAFFACIGGNCPAAPCASTADFNGDGDIGTDADIEAFFRVLGGGHC